MTARKATSSTKTELRDQYLLEEMKQVYEGIRLHQKAYIQLETFSFAGIVACYGFLFSNEHHIPHAVWWSLPVVIAIGAGRSFGHYLAISVRNGPYLALLEKHAYDPDGQELGFQRQIRREPLWFSRMAIIMGTWAALVVTSLTVAMWPTVFAPATHCDPQLPSAVPKW